MLAMTGIFMERTCYASQHNDDTPGYFIHFPRSDTLVGELMIAGYQKTLENDFWGLTNSTVEVKDFMRTSLVQRGMSLGVAP